MEEKAFALLDTTPYVKSDYSIDVLCTVIHDIMHVHQKFSNEFPRLEEFNLKKIQVRDILEKIEDSNTHIINNEFYTYLNDYLTKLNRLTRDLDLEYTYSEYDFRIRVKQRESIIYKLGHYNSGKREMGKIPLNKCLNDLLGFRIIIPNFKHECENFQKMCSTIAEYYKIRYRNSSKGEYKATHVYFYGEKNTYFPWELQIWLPEDFEQNYDSHERHKQEYIKSATIHKHAFEN
ncbi:hypothetical protein [Heyndrickxia ginsengihumi]|uniref:hypothetical protein n=1 Tax=Heyndrickxia ginsengihumi TaxID=363870 RepID=UPI00203D2A72|nr:hypothetical protein [Heyndrickxia ginsengihumi]MCM3024619.1 hypothetical protein [Heyndrickxia ginsengihumi]